jgi:hypothetical protein
MARIRTVKPELWTDPEFIDCSLSARLMFIASWNFATDFGVLPDKPRQLKMQCLPADPEDAELLIEELVSHDFLVRRVAPNGDKVLVIRTFSKNQKINRRSLGRWGDPDKWPPPDEPLTESSLSPHGAPPPGRDSSDSSDDLDDSDLSERHSTRSTDSASDGPADADPKTKKRTSIIDAVLDLRAEGNKIGNRQSWNATVRADIESRHGDKLDRWLHDFPDAPCSLLAGALESGDTRLLSHYAPPPASDEPDRRLTADERTTVLTEAGAALRLVQAPHYAAGDPT